ncbi:MAG: hypothetical protein Q4G10_05375 [Bacteroidia bacterium]|nr:hypothetical protein [Bacteroidia bacterium]
MKTKFFAAAALAALCTFSASAQDAPQLKWSGFICNYFLYDSHENNTGAEELYYFMPKDSDNKGASNFTAISSRLALDVSGYEVDGYKVGAKIEADFYNKNGNVAVLHLRQAYATVAKDGRTWKIGQAWHPMAADMPDIFSLETGAPFGPFSRTPLVSFETKLSDQYSFTAAAIWQMQYPCTGPEGATSNYIKYSGIPELYLGLNFKKDKYLSRIGIDYLSIKPLKNDDGRLSTLNYYMYDEYIGDKWNFRNKLTYASDGSHFNMVGGYGVCGYDDGAFQYSATENVSDWFTVQYKGGKLRPALYLGYTRMFGTEEEIIGDKYTKLSAENVNRMYRIQPEIVYNLGKLAFGLEYMLTSVQYGKSDAKLLATENLHWVSNNRIQMMLKYSF